MDGNSNDAVGSNNGSDTNITYSTANGKINQGAGFDGSTGRLDIGNMVSGQVNISLGAWIKTTHDGIIIEQQEAPNPVTSKFLFAVNGGKLWLFTQSVGSGPCCDGDQGVFGNSTVTDGNWHYVGVSQNGTTYTFYVDGVADGSTTHGTMATYDSVYGGSIGYDRLAYAYGVNPSYFKGSIDEVSVWNTTLSASDFSALYNGGAGKQYPF